MLDVYPYTSPQILTDDIYINYGGEETKGTDPQRDASYFIAEKQVSTHLKTFLLPTIVTGTYSWPPFRRPIQLRHTHIISVNDVTALSAQGDCSCDLRENDGCSFMHDGIYGLIYVRVTNGATINCGTCSSFVPYQARISYQCGLPSGTVYQSDILLALTTVADIILNEIADPSGNESVGDIGIQRWAAQGYSEERIPLIRTVFGTSARANFAAHLLDQAVPNKRALKLGW